MRPSFLYFFSLVPISEYLYTNLLSTCMRCMHLLKTRSLKREKKNRKEASDSCYTIVGIPLEVNSCCVRNSNFHHSFVWARSAFTRTLDWFNIVNQVTAHPTPHSNSLIDLIGRFESHCSCESIFPMEPFFPLLESDFFLLSEHFSNGTGTLLHLSPHLNLAIAECLKICLIFIYDHFSLLC